MITNADQIYNIMGEGLCLCISKTKEEAKVETGFRYFSHASFPVDYNVALTLVSRLHKLEQYQVGSRGGWSDTGIDGNIYDIYCHIQ